MVQRNTLAFWVILVLKWLQRYIVDPILHCCIGYRTLKGSAKDPLAMPYEKSAQRVKVLGRGAYSVATAHFLENFFYKHIEFIHPKEVLKSDNITLMGMDENCAWFCVTDESVDVYDLDKFPFVWTTQFEASQELIILPLWSLIQLYVEDLPKTNLEIIMLFNSARCGSTLACQMFHKLPKTKSMSEPWIGTNLNTVLISGQLNGHDVNALVKACIYLQCKPSIKEPFERIIFKPSLTGSAIIPLVKEACPEIKIMFNTRLPRTSNTSFYQVVKGHVYTDSLSYDLKTWWKYFSFPHHFYHDLDSPYANFKAKVIDKLSPQKMEKFAVGSFAAALLCYLNNKDKVDYLLIYDDWMENVQSITQDMFESLGIPKDYVTPAMTALNRDSQNKFFGNIDGKRSSVMTELQWQSVNEIFKMLNLPLKHEMNIEEFKAFLKSYQRK